MRKPVFGWWILLVAAMPFLAAEEEPAPAQTPIKFTGALDAFYSDDLNHPASGLGQYRVFDWKQDWQLNAAEIIVERDGPRFGFRVDAGYGEMPRILNLPDPWAGVNRYLLQAYVSYKPPLGGLRLDFGKFYSSAGAEAAETYNNFNYSRSLLFALGGPNYHFGLRASMPVTSSFSVGFQFVNGSNDVRDNNSGKSVALISTWTHPKWSFSQTYMTGPEKPGTNEGFRQLYDPVLTLAPTGRLNAYVEALWSSELRVGGGRDRWSGIAEAVQFSLSKKWSVSQRWERFNDSTGFTTGTEQHLMEATATLDYRPLKPILVRSEFRRDWSDRAVFDRDGAPAASRTQTTVLVGLIVVIKGER